MSFSTSSFVVFLFSGVSVLGLACSSTTTTTTTTEATSPADAGVDAEPTPVDESESQEAPDAAPPELACTDAATRPLCEQCCGAFNAEGQQAYHAISTEIVCRETTCKAACASTYCASPASSADAACKKCWNETLPRHADEFFKTCLANEDCAAYSSCIEDAQCSKKPK